MVVLGIDPGLRFSGYSVIKEDKGTTFLIDCGYLALPQKIYCASPTTIP